MYSPIEWTKEDAEYDEQIPTGKVKKYILIVLQMYIRLSRIVLYVAF